MTCHLKFSFTCNFFPYHATDGVHCKFNRDYVMITSRSIILHVYVGMVMVMCTQAIGHMTRGRGLAGWRRALSNVPSTLDRGAMIREMAMASMRTK